MGKGKFGFVSLLSVSVLAHPAFADTTAGVSNIEDFIQSIITVLTACAGLIAAGFFAYGGIRYTAWLTTIEEIITAIKRDLAMS